MNSPVKQHDLGAFEQRFIILCSLLIYASLVTSATEVAQLFSGTALATAQVSSGLRLIREGIYAVILLDFLLCLTAMPRKPLLSRGALLIVAMTALWGGAAIYYSMTLDLPLPVILAGLRFLEYVPLALIAGMIYRSSGDVVFGKIGKAIFVFLVLESILGLVETRLYPLWGTTFLGSRAFGTFTSPNVFGATMVFCFLFILATMPRSWAKAALVITLFDALASGSRAAILCLLFILAAFGFVWLRNVWLRLTVLAAGVAATPLLLVLVSSSALTGRDTGIGGHGGYERLDVWSGVLSKLDSATNFLMGWGMGLGSNTVFTVYGYTIPGAYISDNTFFFVVGSFGIVGVILFAFVLLLLGWKLWRDPAGLATMAAFILLLLISQALEVYPVNILAMLMVGWRLAAYKRSERIAWQPMTAS